MDNNNQNKVITKEVLEPSVQVAGRNKQARVLDFTSRSGSKKGDNYASIISAVDVKASVGNGDVKTFMFIVKEIPPDPARRKIMEDMETFPKEIQVYNVLMPAMMDVQKHFGIKDPVCVEAPLLYSDLNLKGLLVFQDVTPMGYKMGNKFTGLDYDHCRLAMKELGKFHAFSYALKLRAGGTALDELYPFVQESMLTSKLEQMFGPFMENSYDMAIKTVAIVDAPLADRMRPLAGKVYQVCKDIRYDSEGLDIICHGDFWVNNMLFKYEKKGDKEVPVAVKLLDFQIVRYASPTLDLNYFFYTSTPSDVRRHHLNDLLKYYHETFTNTIHSMGLEFPEFTLQRLKQKYAKDRLFGFFFACMALPLMMARPEESLDMDGLEMDINDAQIAEEFKTRMEENLLKMTDNHFFHDRLKGIALDMVDAGLI